MNGLIAPGLGTQQIICSGRLTRKQIRTSTRVCHSGVSIETVNGMRACAVEGVPHHNVIGAAAAEDEDCAIRKAHRVPQPHVTAVVVGHHGADALRVAIDSGSATVEPQIVCNGEIAHTGTADVVVAAVNKAIAGNRDRVGILYRYTASCRAPILSEGGATGDVPDGSSAGDTVA